MQETNRKRGRGGLFWTALGLLTGLLAWRLAGPALTAACRPNTAISGKTVVARSPSGLPYEDLPGVDLTTLSPRQRFIVLHRAAAEHCDCGCKETIAECRHSDDSCKRGLKLALKLRDDVAKVPTLDPGH